MRGLRAAFALGCMLATGCAKPPPAGPPKPKHETAEEEILRVGLRWQSLQEERGFLPAPNPIETFERTISSHLTFVRGSESAEERVAVKERLTLRNGDRLECEASGGVRTSLRYGRHKGQAALQLTRPPAVLTRNCNGTAPEVAIEMPGGASRLELRSDQLVTYEPLGDQRIYLPAD